jgi:hypothetical protein
MKNFTIVLALACSLPAISFASCDNPILKKVASSTHPKQKTIDDLESCKKIPNNPELTIFAEIVEKSESSDYNGSDLSVAIANSNSGEVTANYFKQDFAVVPASANDIKVDTANYKINGDTRAFGVSFSEYDGVNGAVERVNLYVLRAKEIIPILDNIIVSSSSPYKGELQVDCALFDDDIKRTIAIASTTTNGFFDLLVNEKKVKYKVTKKSCDEKEQKIDKTTTKKYTLKYDNKTGAYSVPEGIGF